MSAFLSRCLFFCVLFAPQLYAFKIKAWAVLCNRCNNDSGASFSETAEVEVEIEWELGEGNAVTFFQVSTVDQVSPEVVVPNSQALLQAINQSLYFGAAGPDKLSYKLPDVTIPYELFPRKGSVKLGDTSRSTYTPVEGSNIRIRKYFQQKEPLLTIVTSTGHYGKILNLVFFVFGHKQLYIYLDSLKDFKKKWFRDDRGGDGGGGTGAYLPPAFNRMDSNTCIIQEMPPYLIHKTDYPLWHKRYLNKKLYGTSLEEKLIGDDLFKWINQMIEDFTLEGFWGFK